MEKEWLKHTQEFQMISLNLHNTSYHPKPSYRMLILNK